MFSVPITVKQLIGQASQLLNGKSDSQQLDCQILLCNTLKKTQSYVFTWPDVQLTEQQVIDFTEVFKRRLAGEPIAYIVGEKEFWSLSLKVSPATLIPRPDTETLVDLVLANHQQATLDLLDLGTGTGAIALALASEQPDWHVEAIDFNHDAVALANENKQRNNLDWVSIYQSDWFGNIDNKFDVIVSNPPYIDEQDPHLGEGDVRFEPNSALVAKEQGLEDLKHIIATARGYFKSTGGCLYLEHGYDQAQQVQALFVEYGYQNPRTQKDLGDNPRITYASFSS